jgi:hypothetical protein
MKTILNIASLCIVFLYSSVYAQDTKRWYADDIYYDTSEKELSYIEIVDENDYYYEEDSIEDFYEGRMSYSMRINRFHRDFYNSTLNFNYGYFNDPYTSFWYGYNDPFFNTWGSPYYGWNNYNWYNPWYSPWYYDYYNWNNPYGFGYAYNCGFYAPSCYLPVVYSPTSTTIYGHRNTTGSNTPNSSISRPSRVTTSPSDNAVNIRRLLNQTEEVQRKRTEQKTYSTQTKKRFETTRTTKSSKPKRTNTNSYNRSNQSKSYSRPSNNSRPSNSYSPSRSSGTNRSTSSPSRRPR